MKIKTDLHTHTLASTHAYSTIIENVSYAKKCGLEAIAMTDHGLSTPDCPHKWHFSNLCVIPEVLEGVRILKGAECSYIDMDGNIDLDDNILKNLDIVIASMHYGGKIPVFENKEDYVRLILKGCENPFADIMGHITRIDFQLDKDDCELIADVARQNNKLVELNCECLIKKEIYKKNVYTLMEACNKKKTCISVNTDAHFATLVGQFDNAEKLLDEIGFDEKLIMNRDFDTLKDFMAKKGKRL